MTAPYFDGRQACAGMPTDLFFAGGRYEGAASMQRAKTICRRCIHIEACLEDALTAKLPTGGYVEGVWGGTNAEDRKKIREQRERRGVA